MCERDTDRQTDTHKHTQRSPLGWRCVGQAPTPSTFLSCPPTFPAHMLSRDSSPWTAGHTRVLPHAAGWTLRPLPRHVPFLSCPSAGPPQGLISTVVLWKVSAPRSTLWPDVVIRTATRRDKTPGEKAGARVPEAAAENENV